MDRLQWCLLFLCLMPLCCGICPTSPGCECHSLQGSFHLECWADDEFSGFKVVLSPGEDLQIDCYNPRFNWSEFRLETSEEIRSVSSVEITSCPLPEDGHLGSIIKQLSIPNLEDFGFSSSHKIVALNVSRNTLLGLEQIKYLDFYDNNLVNVPSDFLYDLPQLEYLDFYSNDIEKLPDNFLTMPNLRSVHLRSNRLRVIGPNAFGKLGNLEKFSMMSNKLVEIMPNTFDELTSLKSIDLSDNQLESLPDDIFATLSNLEELSMSENNFTLDFFTRDPLRNNSMLRKLDLHGNKQDLITLPKKFLANMIHLTEFVISENGLVTLPEDLFFGSFNLSILNMENNSIESLPQDLFRDCTSLSELQLSFNRITNLTDNIFLNLKNLLTLNLSNNRIATISNTTFNGLSSLEELDMSRNNLQTIESQLDLPYLRVAKFSYNNLTLQNYPMEKSPFCDCLGMQDLHLAFNRIPHIFDDWFNFREVETLDLRGNELEKITERDLLFPSENLDLRDNNIREFPPSLFQTLKLRRLLGYFRPNKITIAIGNNPLKCDCKVYDLLRYLEEKMNSSTHDFVHLDVESLKCQEPSSLKDILITSLKSETFECLVSEPQSTDGTCLNECDCWLRPNDPTYIIDCSNKSLDQAPAQIRAPEGHLIELNLTGNHLTSMPSMSQPGYDKVTVLSLAHNNIDDIPLHSLSTKFQKLELHNNKLSKIDVLSLNHLRNRENLTKLTLHENFWECNCDLREFLNFIQAMRMRIPSLHSVTCGGEKKKIFEMTPEELCPVVIGWIIASSIGIALVGIIIGGLAALYFRYQQEIKIWLYARRWCLWLVTEDELDKDKIYDAFISYSHHDDDFVVNQLVAKLEGGPRPFKLCVHYRDWPVGEWIPKQVIRSVEDSKRTVVVLSSNFLESEWGKMEFRAAHRQALSEGRARVIVIIYGEIPPIDHLDSELQAYLTMNTYVKWGDPWFWDKLRYALPHRSEVQEKKCNTKSSPQRLPPKVGMEVTE